MKKSTATQQIVTGIVLELGKDDMLLLRDISFKVNRFPAFTQAEKEFMLSICDSPAVSTDVVNEKIELITDETQTKLTSKGWPVHNPSARFKSHNPDAVSHEEFLLIRTAMTKVCKLPKGTKGSRPCRTCGFSSCAFYMQPRFDFVTRLGIAKKILPEGANE